MSKKELLELLDEKVTSSCEWEIWEDNEDNEGIIIMFNTTEESDNA